MRFLTFRDAAGERVGVLAGDRVHPLPIGIALIDLLGDDGTRLRTAGEQALADTHTVHDLADLHLLAPIPAPPTVRDFMTFESHFAGTLLTRGPDVMVPSQWYQAPVFYFTNPYAIVGPRDPVPIAPGSQFFDLELEVAAVIGRPGRDLSVAEAAGHIAGYTILIDWSARDLQVAEMEVGLGPAKAKDTATTLGPFLVTPDELQPFRSGTSFALDMAASINGRVLGQDRMDSMAWSFAEMIAYASRGTDVRPGDVFGSGTCGGGCLAEMWGRHGFDDYPPLAPGDRVSVRIQQLGELHIDLVAGVDPHPITPRR